jgi:hypothetical protein
VSRYWGDERVVLYGERMDIICSFYSLSAILRSIPQLMSCVQYARTRQVVCFEAPFICHWVGIVWAGF